MIPDPRFPPDPGATVAEAQAGPSAGASAGSPPDFFVSYTRDDTAWATWIAWHLEDAGWTVAIQAWDMRPGVRFIDAMHRFAETADRVLLVMSDAALRAPYVEEEWMVAVARERELGRDVLLPVRVRPCRPTGLLRTRVYCDLVGLKPEAARHALLDAASAQRRKPAVPPDLPRARVVEQRPDWPGAVSRWSAAVTGAAVRIAVATVAGSTAAALLLQQGVPEWFETHLATAASASLAAGGTVALFAEAAWRALRRTGASGGPS